MQVLLLLIVFACSLSLRLYGTGQDKPDQLLGSGAKGEVKRGVQEMAWAQDPGETPGKPGQRAGVV